MSTNRLGRGLGALFQEHDIESIESFEQVKEGEVVQQLDVKTLRPNPYQPHAAIRSHHVHAGLLPAGMA